MAGLGWLWLVGTAGCLVVLSGALYLGTRQAARRTRQGVLPEPAAHDPTARVATEGYAGNKPNLPEHYVATDRNSRRVP